MTRFVQGIGIGIGIGGEELGDISRGQLPTLFDFYEILIGIVTGAEKSRPRGCAVGSPA